MLFRLFRLTYLANWKNVACNYCIEKTSRVILHWKNVACNYCIIPEKNVACNSEEKNGECNFEGEKTTSVMVKNPDEPVVDTGGGGG
jgi:hypothetical protein